jgi:hypothetical protein
MKLPDDPQMSLSSRALGRGCRGPSRRSSGPRPGDRSLSRASAPHAIRPSPLSEPADADPDPGPHLRLGRLRHWPWSHGGAARRSRRSRESRPPRSPCKRPGRAGQDDSCDHGDHAGHAGHGGHGAITERTKRARRVTATRTVLAIAEAPGGARTQHSDHGSGPPSEKILLRLAGGVPTTPPGRAGWQIHEGNEDDIAYQTLDVLRVQFSFLSNRWRSGTKLGRSGRNGSGPSPTDWGPLSCEARNKDPLRLPSLALYQE